MEVLQNAPVVGQWHEPPRELHPEIKGLLQRGRILWELLQSQERLLAVRHSLLVGRTAGCLRARLLKGHNRLLPPLTLEGMVRQAFDLGGEAVGGEPFDDLNNPGMEGTPSLVEETAIGYLLRQRMLKRVFQLRKEARLIEKLRRLQMGERLTQGRF